MKKISQILKNNIKYIVGIILIIIGLIVYLKPKYETKRIKEKENSQIEEYIRGQIDDTYIPYDNNINKIDDIKYNYYMVIEIPKIKLKKGLYNKNSKYNSINYGIEILKESEMPNIENSNLILASHSGNSSISFFKNLKQLNIGDEVYIYYNNIKYKYKINDYYSKTKDGTININNSIDNTIYLITCVDDYSHLIYTGILNEKEIIND